MARRRIGFLGLDFFGACLTEIRCREDYDLALLAVPDSTDPRGFMLRQLGERLGVLTLSGPPDAEWTDAVNDAQLDAVVVGAYRWKIPVQSLEVPYCMNVHPSLLPLGRGPNPLPHLFLGSPDAAGVTIHELTQEYDAGPILAQEAIEVAGKDLTDVYLEVVARSSLLLSKVLDDLPGSFLNKVEQSAASSWLPEVPWTDRTFAAEKITVAELEELSSTFGPFGLSALFPDGGRQEVVVRRTLQYDHGQRGGRFVQWSETRGVLQIADGYALVSMSSIL